MSSSQLPIAFEVPLYKKPSDHLRTVMEKLEKVNTSCCAMYQNGKLTFFSHPSEKASLSPCYKENPREKEIAKGLSIFASKFNATNAIVVKEEADMKIEFLNPDSKAKKLYGEDVACILRVTVTCNERSARIILLSFFTMLDEYGN